jgi:putative oxidoreductase
MDVALLALRMVIGLLFVGHGAQKLFGWFGGGGLSATGAFFEQAGLRPGKLHAAVGGSAEFFGGLALALGLLTPIAAMALIGVMSTAILAVHAANGIWNTKKGFEYNLVLITAMFAIAAMGAGEASLDDALGLDLAGLGWAFGALALGLLGGIAAATSGRVLARREGHGPHPSAA